ncbi:MAG: quinolinate synthase NadA [Chloroflexi bacterium]|nr:quinolinate synthase NadA [Chloroflexota bacterium]MCI0883305.1 quinolinate synthase NadA [Chloroflexota bacterium]
MVLNTTPKRPVIDEIDVLNEANECTVDRPLETTPLSAEHAFAYWQNDIPEAYWDLDGEALAERIATARAKLGERCVILGHHYQREDIIQFTDLRGDSFKLARWAAERPDAEFIVFCGVHFMAEAADILAAPHQKVVLPNMSAGCSMADMAEPDDVYACWDELREAGIAESTIPVTYMNSAAALKAFCGENGGIVCTSSNAPNVYDWSFERGDKVLFFPDQHLGRNTGIKKGVSLDEMVVWDYTLPYGSLGGNTREELERAKVILWKGWCSVHRRFSVAQIEKARAEYPGVKVIVHPECTMEVLQAADMDGSTEVISRAITEAPAGSTWAVGTEINLVSRLARENPDKTVFCLDPVVCPCATMYRIHPAYLAWTLDELAAGRIVNRVEVPADIAKHAKVALERMLSVK